MIMGMALIILAVFNRNIIALTLNLSLICFGILALFKGGYIRKESDNIYSNISFVIGIIMLLFGCLALFYPNILSFLNGFEYYIIVPVLLIFGINGILSNLSYIFDLSSILTIIIGIILIYLAVFSSIDSMNIIISLTITLIGDGIALFISY